jgi:hypothetical protein
MAISKSDIKFYLTGEDPETSQATRPLSTGGYPSTIEYLTSTTLSSAVGRAATALTVPSVTGFTSASYVLVGDEVVGVETPDSGDTSLAATARGSLGTNARYQPAGSLVYPLSVSSLFDGRSNADRKQYRCVAIKNTSDTETAYDVSVYLKAPSVNTESVVRFAVEIPRADAYTGVASSGSKSTLTDLSIPSTFADNAFAGCVVVMGSGENEGEYKTVLSYDAASRTMVFDGSFTSRVGDGDSFDVRPSPAQRVVSGRVSPVFGGDRVGDLSAASSSAVAQTIDVHGNRGNGSDLLPGDVVYVWFERTLGKNAEAYDNNRVVLALRYRK